MKYFVIGERELVLAFALVGVQGTAAANRSEALDSFYRITGRGNAVVGTPAEQERPKVLILTEQIADMLADEIIDWQMKGDYPLIVEIPGIHGHLAGRKTMTDAIREAVGIHV
ncbi:V-type ATP synthase subunit F [Treponema lecithinolyticum]|uniref:V-type ATP synthase subunit F n=1 Tax=Treponema lecithinolyticum TaxID=53418 RepID=UPI0028EB9A2C|nr:V-type ATP synthase subunit F [Treponema lecithinolyticum]